MSEKKNDILTWWPTHRDLCYHVSWLEACVEANWQQLHREIIDLKLANQALREELGEIYEKLSDDGRDDPESEN